MSAIPKIQIVATLIEEQGALELDDFCRITGLPEWTARRKLKNHPSFCVANNLVIRYGKKYTAEQINELALFVGEDVFKRAQDFISSEDFNEDSYTRLEAEVFPNGVGLNRLKQMLALFHVMNKSYKVTMEISVEDSN